MKEKALEKVMPMNTPFRRFRASDSLLAFLESSESSCAKAFTLVLILCMLPVSDDDLRCLFCDKTSVGLVL